MNIKQIVTVTLGFCAFFAAFGFVGAGDFEYACITELHSQGYSSADCVAIIDKLESVND